MEGGVCQAESLFELCHQLPIGLRDSNDLQVRPLLKLVEESERVPMRQPRKRHAQRHLFALHLRLILGAQIRACASPHHNHHQEKPTKTISPHTPPRTGSYLSWV